MKALDLKAALWSRLLNKAGSKRSSGKGKRNAVLRSMEFLRVRDMPRRLQDDDTTAAAFAGLLTERLKTPQGTMALRPLQATMLIEAVDHGGLFSSLPVGAGKSIVAPLFPVVMQSKVCVMLFPPAVRAQMEMQVLPMVWKHFKKPDTQIVLLSYHQLSSEQGVDLLHHLKPDLIVADECFADGTPVWTPNGLRPIESLCVGDEILAVSTDGVLSVEQVLAKQERTANDPVDVVIGDEVLRTTANHPFLSDSGRWVAAERFNNDRAVCLVQEREMQNEVQPLLREKLLGIVAYDATSNQSESAQQNCARKNSKITSRMVRERGGAASGESLVSTHDRAQPDANAGSTWQSRSIVEKDRTQTEDTRRQRPRADASSVSSLVASWMADGVRGLDKRTRAAISESLQNRHSRSVDYDGNRGRRQQPQRTKSPRSRPQEGSISSFAWVARDSRNERPSAEERAAGRRVHTIEVSGPSTYLVGQCGAVVHNCHMLKHKTAARTKRFLHYFKENPQTRLIAMSGTITSKSLRDFQHLMALTHSFDMPLPKHWPELEDWSLAIDPEVGVDKNKQPKQRLAPGALLELCEQGETAAQGVGRRISETHGVVTSANSSIGTSLYITRRNISVPDKILKLYDQIEKSWEIGDQILVDGARVAQKLRELSCGFYYKWVWPDGEVDREWLDARSEWSRYVRDVTRRGIQGLDTELLVRNNTAALLNDKESLVPKSLQADGMHALDLWNTQADKDEPPVEPVWIDGFVIEYARKWAAQHPRGIVWFEHRATGDALAAAGLRVFAAGPKANKELVELAASPHDAGPIACSVRAHATGKNLQFRWHENLLLLPIASGAITEQLIGRTHRPGQTEDEVNVDVLFTFPERASVWFSRAYQQSTYIRAVSGASQKLLDATLVDLPVDVQSGSSVESVLSSDDMVSAGAEYENE